MNSQVDFNITNSYVNDSQFRIIATLDIEDEIVYLKLFDGHRLVSGLSIFVGELRDLVKKIDKELKP